VDGRVKAPFELKRKPFFSAHRAKSIAPGANGGPPDTADGNCAK
jgi:hypothetical protein